MQFNFILQISEKTGNVSICGAGGGGAFSVFGESTGTDSVFPSRLISLPAFAVSLNHRIKKKERNKSVIACFIFDLVFWFGRKSIQSLLDW